MRTTLLFLFALSAAPLLHGQSNWSVKGTVTRMRMTDCVMQRGFLLSMSGGAAPAAARCPEYTLMNDKVVYVVVGRRGEEFMPLAENVAFVIRKNELVVFSDDEKTKSRFFIQRMMLRADWDGEEARKELAARMIERSANYEARNAPLSYTPGTK